MESVRKNVFVSTQVASPQQPYSRVGLTPHMLMTYMPPRNRQSNNQRSRGTPVNRHKYVLNYIQSFLNNYPIYLNLIFLLALR